MNYYCRVYYGITTPALSISNINNSRLQNEGRFLTSSVAAQTSENIADFIIGSAVVTLNTRVFFKSIPKKTIKIKIFLIQGR